MGDWMRCHALFAGLALIACSKGPTAPEPLPPLVFQNMVGGWSGTYIQTSTSIFGPQSRVCTEVWLITTQTEGYFSGTYQRSGEDCIRSGQVGGFVNNQNGAQIGGVGGTVSNRFGPCLIVSGDLAHRGFVSARSLTAQATYTARCPDSRGRFADYATTATYAMDKR